MKKKFIWKFLSLGICPLKNITLIAHEHSTEMK